MLDNGQIDSAQRRLADSFLIGQRPAPVGIGWGQFIGPGTQVGLYGTCSGVICVASAYGAERIPEGVISYLQHLWEDRSKANSKGARNFALTARLAFFLMALRHARHPALSFTSSEVDSELRERALNDGLLVSWKVDSERRSQTGDEFSTALAIMAYALTAHGAGDIPNEIGRAAQALQSRIAGALPSNRGVRKFYLAAIAAGLPPERLTSDTKRLVRADRAQAESRDQDTLFFWDYRYLKGGGLSPRRDYFHVPSDAVDILLATSGVAGRFQKLTALDFAESDAREIIDRGSYFAGRDLAASKVQAWTSLALNRTTELFPVKTVGNRILQSLFAATSDNIFGGLIVPGSALLLAAVASALPTTLLWSLQALGLVAAIPPEPNWWLAVSSVLQTVGIIVLTVSGQTFWKRISHYIRRRLP